LQWIEDFGWRTAGGQWHRNFERFRGRFQEKFEKFEEWLRSSMLIEKEQFLGAYYEKSDRGDEDDKVLS
jgi:hypothetical protein